MDPTPEEVRALRRFERFCRYDFILRPGRDDECDFSALERDVLREMNLGEGASGAGQLTERFGVDPAQMSRILARFERMGFVESHRAAYDGRIALVTPSRVARATSTGFEAWENSLARESLRSLPRKDRARLAQAAVVFESLWCRAKRLTVRER